MHTEDAKSEFVRESSYRSRCEPFGTVAPGSGKASSLLSALFYFCIIQMSVLAVVLNGVSGAPATFCYCC